MGQVGKIDMRYFLMRLWGKYMALIRIWTALQIRNAVRTFENRKRNGPDPNETLPISRIAFDKAVAMQWGDLHGLPLSLFLRPRFSEPARI